MFEKFLLVCFVIYLAMSCCIGSLFLFHYVFYDAPPKCEWKYVEKLK